MKISLLITGQIRDRAVFENLLGCINSCADHFNKIIYCSWDEEISRARQIAANFDRLILVEAGALLPVRAFRDASIISYIAQHQQICSGIDETGGADFLLRIRADNAALTTETLALLHDVIELSLSSESDRPKSIILGASGRIPFFFDDRIMMLSPDMQAAIRDKPLSSLYQVDSRNLFPEFLFYSAGVSKNKLFRFIAYDHRLRHYEVCLRSVLHGVSTFGKIEYIAGVHEYLNYFDENFIFFKDALAKHPKISEADELGRLSVVSILSTIVAGFDVHTISEFKAGYMKNIADYATEYSKIENAIARGEIAVFSVSDKLSAQKSKRHLNYIREVLGDPSAILPPAAVQDLPHTSITPIIRYYYALSAFREGRFETCAALLRENIKVAHNPPKHAKLLNDALSKIDEATQNSDRDNRVAPPKLD